MIGEVDFKQILNLIFKNIFNILINIYNSIIFKNYLQTTNEVKDLENEQEEKRINEKFKKRKVNVKAFGKASKMPNYDEEKNMMDDYEKE